MTRRSRLAALLATAACCVAPSATAETAPAAAHPELVTVLHRLDAWLPGEWDNLPQLLVERQLGAPPDGEHDHWYRVITRIDAPQLGSHVYYGEVYQGGRGGDLIPGQQLLYVAEIDPVHFAVNLKGGGLAEPGKFRQLHLHPELWRKVRMREGAGPCLFLWRRSGEQLAGTLGTEGTCTVQSQRTGKMMLWDAEWVLGPEQLWILDNGYFLGPGPGERSLFMGREDRTHHRAWRLTDYRCEVAHGGARVALRLHDRGDTAALEDGTSVQLLRGPIVRPGGKLEQGFALRVQARGGPPLEAVSPLAAREVALDSGALAVSCSPDGSASAPRATPARRAALPVAAAAPATSTQAVAARACDAERGRSLAPLCEACHALTPGAQSISGPNLSGLIGRKAGTAAGYTYSRAMQDSGITWDRATLDRFLAHPAAAVPGTVMTFVGVKDGQDRADLVCHLERVTAQDR